MSENPILDLYVMAYAAGEIGYPVSIIFEMPSSHGKSLTTMRFFRLPNVLVLPGDTTAQGFRNVLKKKDQKNEVEKLNLIIIEDASKIRRKCREDFFALAAQFATGIVNIDQQNFDLTFKTHASIVINSPPFFTKSVERLLLESGSGDRFQTIRSMLSEPSYAELELLGSHNMPNNLCVASIPKISNSGLSYSEYVKEKRYENHRIAGKDLRYKYALFCAGLDENLIDRISSRKIEKCCWSGYWENQISPE